MKIDNDNIGKYLKEGHDDAYEFIYNNYYSFLVDTAYRILRDLPQSQDIVQTVILAVWDKPQNIQEDQNIFAYFNRAVHNRCLKFIRDTGRKNKRKERYLDSVEDRFEFDAMAENELLTILNKVLGELSEKQRNVFKLNRFEGYTYKEIAEHLEIPQKTVEYNMSVAIKKVYAAMENYLHLLIIGLINILNIL
ncbi:MAG: RNA polymerase sigma-70 factor [Flavobacteriales bacterium]|nr:RNA polymerase sigma-70 factor [Flavobacteriales bacterium]